MLRALDDRYGEFEQMQAQQAHRNDDLKEAFAALARAELKPRSNKQNIRFIRCIWQIDSGDFSGLDEAVSHAIAVGRADEALHLRSRAAFQSGNIDEADRIWREIKKPHYMDLQLRVRILDELLKRHPGASSAQHWQVELDRVLAATRRTTVRG